MICLSCRKEEGLPTHETGTVTDRDGNIYKTVKIGDQWWMAENLKVKTYQNGDSISFCAADGADTSWSSLKTGAYSVLNTTFGYLYNFYAVADSRRIAPAGWHIPSDEEWKVLESYLGMSSSDLDVMNWRGTDQGNQLKIAGGNTTYWINSSDQYSIFGTNSSGFTAIGGACRVFNGSWGDLAHTAFWWTSTPQGETACYRGLDYNKADVFRYYGSKNYGFSLRCLKD